MNQHGGNAKIDRQNLIFFKTSCLGIKVIILIFSMLIISSAIRTINAIIKLMPITFHISCTLSKFGSGS